MINLSEICLTLFFLGDKMKTFENEERENIDYNEKKENFCYGRVTNPSIQIHVHGGLFITEGDLFWWTNGSTSVKTFI